MRTRNMHRKNRSKKIGLVLAVLLLIVAAIAGTMAWLTAQDEVENTFTVGSFNKPNIDPDGGNDPEPDPNVPEDEKPTKDDDYDMDGYIFEPSWNKNVTHKILPGVSFYKDPYVGIGDGSEEAKVFVYIDNDFANEALSDKNPVYFQLNTSNWTPVEAQGFTKNGVQYYTGGLFKYDSILTASGNGGNTWTNSPVFSKILVADEIDASDLPAGGTNAIITVKAFLHQVKDANGDAIAENVMVDAAKEAFEINSTP